jgi:hypothetical protein
MDIHNIIHCLIVGSSRMNDVGGVILWVSPKFVVMTFTKLLKKTTEPLPLPMRIMILRFAKSLLAAYK